MKHENHEGKWSGLKKCNYFIAENYWMYWMWKLGFWSTHKVMFCFVFWKMKSNELIQGLIEKITFVVAFIVKCVCTKKTITLKLCKNKSLITFPILFAVNKAQLKTPRSKKLSSGSDLRIKCKVTNKAVPAPAIAWYKDGALLTPHSAQIDTRK